MKKTVKLKSANGRKGAYRWATVVFLTVCAVTVVFSFQYYGSLHNTIREESKSYLQEVSGRIGSNVNRIIADNYAALNTTAAMLENHGTAALEDVEPVLERQLSLWGYESILLLDISGKAYGLDGLEVVLNLDSAVRKDILDKKESMSTSQMVNSRELSVFSVPLNHVTVNGKELVALAAAFDPASFNQVLSMTSFNEQSYSQIVLKSGTSVTKPTAEGALKTGYNVFSSLEDAKLDEGGSLSKMREDIAGDRSGQLSFTVEGDSWYLVYTPINPEEWYLLTFVPVQVVNERSDMLLRSTLLICGLVVVVFAVLMAALIYIFGANRRRLEKLAYEDPVTGGNTIQRFYQLAKAKLDAQPGRPHALVYSNIEKFKVLNDQLGHQNCDAILRGFHKLVSVSLVDGECIGRISADNFCILLNYGGEEELLKRFSQWYAKAGAYTDSGMVPWTLPLTEFGIYVVENTDLTFPQMVDRAKLALKESPRNIEGKLRCAFYDDKVRRQLYREKHLEDIMDDALKNGGFMVYLQPKYRLPEEKIGGAEALVRWEDPQEGMIYPNEFIPLFEKNGFVIKLDLWVFGEVCRQLREWTDRGLDPVKISVNCSRVHFRDPDFLAPYIRLADQWAVDRSLLEIELTESVVLENTDRLLAIIENIRSAGFGCSMDDFGSGYSSLNMIQNIPVDTLKLDRIFFSNESSEAGRTEAVVSSIVSMAKALNMETVAEGVELRHQVEMLKRVGCNYIQGYVFAKPMDLHSFEKLAFCEDRPNSD